MSFVAPRIVNNVSYVTDINHESHFAWQAQHLVILERHFSWQAQYLVKFGSIACNFKYKTHLGSAKNDLGERAGAR